MTDAIPAHKHDAQTLSNVFEARSAHELLTWAIERFGTGLVVGTSFQAEGGVTLDTASRIDPSVRVITVDSGRLHPETYELIDRFRDRYRLDIEVRMPDAGELEDFVRSEGVNPFYRSVALRMRCCEIRKVDPMRRALKGAEAWVAGLRRKQSESRAGVGKVEIDGLHGNIFKISPLADWSNEDVWSYIRTHDVPYHPLYDSGYQSIGCAPCSRACKQGEHGRAGRWWWEDDSAKECGIHTVRVDEPNDESLAS